MKINWFNRSYTPKVNNCPPANTPSSSLRTIVGGIVGGAAIVLTGTALSVSAAHAAGDPTVAPAGSVACDNTLTETFTLANMPASIDVTATVKGNTQNKFAVSTTAGAATVSLTFSKVKAPGTGDYEIDNDDTGATITTGTFTFDAPTGCTTTTPPPPVSTAKVVLSGVTDHNNSVVATFTGSGFTGTDAAGADIRVSYPTCTGSNCIKLGTPDSKGNFTVAIPFTAQSCKGTAPWDTQGPGGLNGYGSGTVTFNDCAVTPPGKKVVTITGFALQSNCPSTVDTIGVNATASLNRVTLVATLNGKTAQLSTNNKLEVPSGDKGEIIATINDTKNYQFKDGSDREVVVVDQNTSKCTKPSGSSGGSTSTTGSSTTAAAPGTGVFTPGPGGTGDAQYSGNMPLWLQLVIAALITFIVVALLLYVLKYRRRGAYQA